MSAVVQEIVYCRLIKALCLQQYLLTLGELIVGFNFLFFCFYFVLHVEQTFVNFIAFTLVACNI